MVIWQGEAGDNMYLVEDGKFEAAIRPAASLALSDMLSLEGIDTMGEVVASHAEGTIFGERALMQNMPRAASVRCVEEGRLWAIDRLTFRKVTLGEALAQPKTAQSTQGEEEEDAAEVAAEDAAVEAEAARAKAARAAEEDEPWESEPWDSEKQEVGERSFDADGRAVDVETMDMRRMRKKLRFSHALYTQFEKIFSAGEIYRVRARMAASELFTILDPLPPLL